MNTVQLRDDLRHGQSGDVQRRRAIIAASLVGMAGMGLSMLFQTGIVRHLPDPPIGGFDSDKVNSSHEAYRLGVPDGPLAVLDFAANLPLAAFGGAQRAGQLPWIPVLAGAKSVVDALVAVWYFSLMPRREHAWCGYCIVATLANVAIAALAWPEARQAWQALRA